MIFNHKSTSDPGVYLRNLNQINNLVQSQEISCIVSFLHCNINIRSYCLIKISNKQHRSPCVSTLLIPQCKALPPCMSGFTHRHRPGAKLLCRNFIVYLIRTILVLVFFVHFVWLTLLFSALSFQLSANLFRAYLNASICCIAKSCAKPCLLYQAV